MSTSTLILIIIGIPAYLSVALVVAWDGFEPVDAAWWPIHAAKALLKSLWRALFTGWRP